MNQTEKHNLTESIKVKLSDLTIELEKLDVDLEKAASPGEGSGENIESLTEEREIKRRLTRETLGIVEDMENGELENNEDMRNYILLSDDKETIFFFSYKHNGEGDRITNGPFLTEADAIENIKAYIMGVQKENGVEGISKMVESTRE